MKLKALSLAVILATAGCGDNADIAEHDREEMAVLVDAPTQEIYGSYDYENEEYEEVIFEEDEDKDEDDSEGEHESDYDGIDAGDMLLGASVGAALANSGSGKAKISNSKTVIIQTPPRAPGTGLSVNLGAKPPVVKPKPPVVKPAVVSRMNTVNQRNNITSNNSLTSDIKVTKQQAQPTIVKKKGEKKAKR
ncbi:TPA: hypothetical protein I7730_00445 [Vibrio vulnificus]|uniref:Lipoprotein n=1 Tax=Vibrio vulnificus TaxID=672 RepID=A0A8H9K6Q1_VIBVL|nr:hypothetical protein [Vibrio vulnificus]